jgi:hypothetical protein
MLDLRIFYFSETRGTEITLVKTSLIFPKIENEWCFFTTYKIIISAFNND